MLSIFQKRCKHRHTAATHPHCFVNGEPVQIDKPKNGSFPKVLVFDLERIPDLHAIWQTGKQYVSARSIVQEGCLVSWAAKWLYSPDTMGRALTPTEIKNRDDGALIGELWHLIDEADIVIGHNINRFDIPLLRTRLLVNGYMPPSHFKTIDTYVVSGTFKFPARSMGFINEYLEIKEKKEESFQLWLDCMAGSKAALAEMLEYNRIDVEANEEMYTVLRPWITNHPEMSVYGESIVEGMCRCGSTNIDKHGRYTTNRAAYEGFRCLDCGSIGRYHVNILSKKANKSDGK